MITAKQARIAALETEIGRILQMSPEDRKVNDLDLKLTAFVAELNELTNKQLMLLAEPETQGCLSLIEA